MLRIVSRCVMSYVAYCFEIRDKLCMIMHKGVDAVVNIIAGIIVVLLVVGASFYIYKEKKKGRRCIGCPMAGSCPRANCCGCNKGKACEQALPR